MKLILGDCLSVMADMEATLERWYPKALAGTAKETP